MDTYSTLAKVADQPILCYTKKNGIVTCNKDTTKSIECITSEMTHESKVLVKAIEFNKPDLVLQECMDHGGFDTTKEQENVFKVAAWLKKTKSIAFLIKGVPDIPVNWILFCVYIGNRWDIVKLLCEKSRMELDSEEFKRVAYALLSSGSRTKSAVEILKIWLKTCNVSFNDFLKMHQQDTKNDLLEIEEEPEEDFIAFSKQAIKNEMETMCRLVKSQ